MCRLTGEPKVSSTAPQPSFRRAATNNPGRRYRLGLLDSKLTLYEEYGIASYWLVDPSIPSITVLELVDGRYTETAAARGDQTIEVDHPFRVALNPAELAAQ